MKNDFINNLTHEFKTPIFSIDLASSILKKAPELQKSNKLLRYVDVIENEGKRLSSQVDKVLQMALVDSGNFKLEKKNIDIHELIFKVVKNFEILVNDRGGKIELNLLANKTILFVDETHLKNILYNLLDNAQKYSTNNPEIVITTEDSEVGLSLSIQDNGIGINEHIQQYVFDKFYRGDSSDIHNIKGFGLGLSYVKSVIDAHKAKIDLISDPDTGSTFVLEFYS
jgi:two-component system phosphate regulon sensor histidine kinase PhoR